jgi:hypothetical protein
LVGHDRRSYESRRRLALSVADLASSAAFGTPVRIELV